MQFRVFSIPATGSPDLEEEMNLFLRSHRIVSTQRALQPVDGVLRWCFCIEYLDGAKVSSNVKPSGRTERIDYKEVLPPEDFALFARLREVRKELAAMDAVPVYTVCTNEQLAEMASKRPGSLAALKEIEGLARTSHHSSRMLLVRRHSCVDFFAGHGVALRLVGARLDVGLLCMRGAVLDRAVVEGSGAAKAQAVAPGGALARSA